MFVIWTVSKLDILLQWYTELVIKIERVFIEFFDRKQLKHQSIKATTFLKVAIKYS